LKQQQNTTKKETKTNQKRKTYLDVFRFSIQHSTSVLHTASNDWQKRA
jgi:hypothetical protein